MRMEQALSARALLALALLAPGTALAKAGPDRAATQALVKQCEGKEDFSAPAPPARRRSAHPRPRRATAGTRKGFHRHGLCRRA